MRRFALAIVPISFAFAATSFALPPGAERRGLREGANHRVGDDSFVERIGRTPAAADREKLRMRVHLQYVRDLLATRPATRPALAAKRAELLGYLDDYIANGVAPRNEALPWRSPVFIDDDGNICAVGYLIERSVGRGLAEQVAHAHRYEFLEDIAAAMPAVSAWIEASGLTLDELASIQPGYLQPSVEDWIRWDVAKLPPPDGAYRDRVTTGAWRHRRMEGRWTRTAGETVVGRGELSHGNGTWTSFYRDGSKMAEGPMARNDPDGAWTLFHPSGNVAAQGRFARGMRDGLWRFYHDTTARTPIATGRFARGALVGTWRHYDTTGKLLARSMSRGALSPDPPADPAESPPSIASPRSSTTTAAGDGFGQYLLSVVPGSDGVVHDIDLIGGPDLDRLDAFVDAGERLFVYGDDVYDADGNLLTRQGEHWVAASCHWAAKRRRIASAGDVGTLHHLLSGERFGRGAAARCGAQVSVPAARGRRIDRLLAQQHVVRSTPPEFVRRLALGEELGAALAATVVAGDDGDADGRELDDLPRLLAANMVWYIEWPHIDRRFVQLFKTVPGYWQGRPNGEQLPEADREQLEGIVDPAAAE